MNEDTVTIELNADDVSTLIVLTHYAPVVYDSVGLVLTDRGLLHLDALKLALERAGEQLGI